MEIRNLITFVHVAELNSFTKAAKVLDYSQSTISFQIKQLENELDCLLFERINHTITLTERGRELLSYARQVCYLTEEFTQTNREPRELQGYLRIAAPDSVCEEMMTANYTDFHARYPGISLQFTTASTETMMHMIDHNEADLMLALDSLVCRSDYVIAMEEPVEMYFITGACSPYASEGELSLREAAQMPFLLTESGMGYRRSLEQLLASQSLEVQPILELGRTDVIVRMLERGVGVSFLPDFVVRRGIEEGKLVRLRVTDAKTDIRKQLIYHKNKWVTRAMSALLEYIKANEFGRGMR